MQSIDNMTPIGEEQPAAQPATPEASQPAAGAEAADATPAAEGPPRKK
jgi:hypothetical protein